MWLLLVALLAGGAFGYLSAGRQDKSQLFMRGLLIGILVAVVVGILSFLFGINPLGLADTGFFGILISAILISVAFIIGVWIGDALEHRRMPGGRPRV